MSHIGTDFQVKLQHYRQRVESALDRYLPASSQPPCRLHEAMRYAALLGGKRVRPFLVYATGEALKTDNSALDAAAAAVELIHAYSLTHDDLPAMDNDELRRGQPTAHIAFDEPTAILAGDALQSLAFDVLTHEDAGVIDGQAQLAMIRTLARASGSHGMAGGQAIDLDSVGASLDEAALRNMHAHKTGALIEAAVKMGACAAGLLSGERLEALLSYARAVGLAFQVRDDILDVEGDTAVIGKTQGADQALNKPTYTSLLGLDGAKTVARNLHQEALASLEGFDEGANTLRALSAFIVERSS